MIEMIAAVKMSQRHEFQHDAQEQRRAERQDNPKNEIPGPRHEGRGKIGPHHVERTMRQIDQVHDAEYQRQPRREQKQQQAELQSVQELFDDKQHRHFKSVFCGPLANRGFSFHPPLEGEGRLTLSEAKCETGWGGNVSLCGFTPPRRFASTLPLEGRVRLPSPQQADSAPSPNKRRQRQALPPLLSKIRDHFIEHLSWK